MRNKGSSNNGLEEAHVSRIIKSLEITTIVFNCFGFSLLIIKPFFFLDNPYFLQILDQTFTFLIFIQIILNISIKYWMFRARHPPSSSPPNQSPKIKTIIFGIIESFKNIYDLIHFLLIFLQPNIFLPHSINQFIYNIAPLRIYTLIRFCLMLEFLLNPSFLRICKSFNKSKPMLALKVAYKKYFVISIVSFISVIVVGFGNLMKDEELDIFQDIYVAAYYIFVTISTVGYGDYVPSNTLPRVVSVVILILGVFIMSLLTYVVLKETKLDDQEGISYYQMKKLENKEEAMGFVMERFVELMDESMKEEKRKEEEKRREILAKCKQGFRKEEKNKIFEAPVNTSKKNILYQDVQVIKANPFQNAQQTSERSTQIYEKLQQLTLKIQYLQSIDPIRILMARHKLQRIKKKITPLSLTTLQFLDITKPKIYNQPGHRSFYTKQRF